ncbi:unnamed protein product, partial [Iphiclides podalirius]
MEYQHPQPVQPLGPPAPPPQLLPPAPPPPLPTLPQLQHGHVQDDDRWSQYHIWRQHVFVNGQCSQPAGGRVALAHFLQRTPSAAAPKEKVRDRTLTTRLQRKFSAVDGAGGHRSFRQAGSPLFLVINSSVAAHFHSEYLGKSVDLFATFTPPAPRPAP